MVEFTLKCKECNHAVANSNNVLGRHVRKAHRMEWPDYVVKHEYAGVWPLCGCGCGERLAWKKGGFSTCIKEHSSRGERNGMFGRRGQDSPNTGKVRTEEHRRRYSEAAKKRWDEEYEKRVAALNTEQYRERQTISQRVAYETTDRRERLSESINRFWDEDPRAPELRKEASLRAIDLLEQGKIGPQAPYRAEWKWNPFFERDEYMHSSWESAFLDRCITEGRRVTKKHDVRIRYTDENGVDRTYVPDFVAPDERVIYEVKGYETVTDGLKAAACRVWCEKEGWKHEIAKVHCQVSKGYA